MKKIAFIGLGVMGAAMAENILAAGYELRVFTRTKEKAARLIQKGAEWFPTAALCAEGSDAVITMVGFPKDVEEVYFGESGIFKSVKAGQYLIDMTTTSPSLSERIYAAAAEKGAFALDAPVSGGDAGAKNAALSIMVGGDKAAFDSCLALFGAMGKTVIYEGRAGSGQHTKAANQIAVAGAVAGVAEAVAYAVSQKLDTEKLFASISKGAAASFQLDSNGPKMLKGDYAPGFFVKHFIKDMKIACDEARKQNVSLPVLNEILGIYEKLAENGFSDSGTQAIIENYK